MGIIDSALERSCCANCLYWDATEGTSFGKCRRHAPVVGDSEWGVHPVTGADVWCGEHERA